MYTYIHVILKVCALVNLLYVYIYYHIYIYTYIYVLYCYIHTYIRITYIQIFARSARAISHLLCLYY